MVKRKATNDGKEDEGEQMILKYMKKVNRPYSATDIFNNLHGKYSKPSVVRALDSLTDQNELFVKTYGKMQVYAVKQNIEGIKNEDLEGLQKQVTVLEGKMSNMVEDNRKLNHTLSDLKKEPTTENAKALLEKRKRENAQMREHLETLKSGAVLVTQKIERRMMPNMSYTEKNGAPGENCLEIFSMLLQNTCQANQQHLWKSLGLRKTRCLMKRTH
ncbi:Tat binding protein 1-interacting protein-domain-containing protein [Phycomyces blakesleeanus]|uniref:Tat binding protein 1-interacting protein-domain-containing protein n=1 Tax=Phycomyces blakesleeanus TaxID=4837 RepID=A0ABR3B2K2_PHYBL